MPALSHWAHTKTFFPLLVSELERRDKVGRALIIGASDGKFVLPLAAKGWHVTALEIDPIALFGGSVEFPKGTAINSPGLFERVREHSLDANVQIVQDDFYEYVTKNTFDVVFTSCSWHYSRNHHRPVREYILKMQDCVAPEGLFCAEFMMPVEPRHFGSEHYMTQGQIRRYFGTTWNILEEFYTMPFLERAHVGNLSDHVHQMGFFMAVNSPPA